MENAMVKKRPDLLRSLAENEEAIGVLYREYASRFPDYDSFWLGLSADEKEHAGWIRMLSSTIDQGGLFVNQSRFSEQAILSYLDYLQRELAKVRQGDTTLLNALAITLYIEESLIEKKYFEVFESDAPRLKQVLENLAAATRNHIERARQALDSYKQLSASSE
jgi:rubrerythrin